MQLKMERTNNESLITYVFIVIYLLKMKRLLTEQPLS